MLVVDVRVLTGKADRCDVATQRLQQGKLPAALLLQQNPEPLDVDHVSKPTHRLQDAGLYKTMVWTSRGAWCPNNVMGNYVHHPGVDSYINALPEWQQALCGELRDVIHEAEPDIVETIKRRVQPYFVLDGNVCALLAAKNHVNLFLYDGAIVPDPAGIITAGHDNKTGRMISFYVGEEVPTAPLIAMLRQIAANNRAGGWRKIKAGLQNDRKFGD